MKPYCKVLPSAIYSYLLIVMCTNGSVIYGKL